MIPNGNRQTGQATEYAGIEALWEDEKCLVAYTRDVVRKLSRCSMGHGEVLEFGAGIGTLAQLWHARTGTRPECLEIDKTLLEVLAKRNFVCHPDLSSLRKTYDTIYTSNVLEHIEDDVEALRKLHANLKPGGVLAVYVPAFMCLYSNLDLEVGHYRRYRKAELKARLEQAGFRIEGMQYVDSLGFLAWFAMKLLSRQGGGASNNSGKLKFYDTWIYPISNLLDNLGLKHVIGKNILVISRRA